MARFSAETLTRAHRFMLEIHAADDVETQRRVIPRRLAELIPCDRAALNEFIVGPDRVVVPSPVPAYWSRLRQVFHEHLHEHVLTRTMLPTPHRAVTFGDRRNDPAWKSSTLYHEYYVPAGARHQLSVHTFSAGPVKFMLNCNRESRDFSRVDRALLQLLSPHVECALRNLSRIGLLPNQPGTLARVDAPRVQTVVVDRDGRIAGIWSAQTNELLRKYFGTDAGPGNSLPDPLRGWFAAQRRHLQAIDALGHPPAILCLRRESTSLTARLGQVRTESAVIFLTERVEDTPPPKVFHMGFTPRESEVARWMCEGKRNAEIGTILGISVRTVGKHVEHIFEKLGVETRTAAARAVRESASPLLHRR
jgi:DNA-binding CsgD family transcriptional regulator